MAKQRVIVVLIVCLTLAVFTGRLLSRQRIRPTLPDAERLRGLTNAEASEFIAKWIADRGLQERISRYEYFVARMKQAFKNELRVSEGQWRFIEPKYDREVVLMCDAWAAASRVTRSGKASWVKATEGKGAALPKTAAELTEGERNVAELIDLLRREDSTDEELRKQIDALQRAREEARKEWPKAKRELAAALTTPRQEAVFLLLGCID